MENRDQQILSEITSLIESIKSQLAVLEDKLAQINKSPVLEEEDLAPIDLEIIEDEDVADVVEMPVEEPVEELIEEPVETEEPVEDDDLPFYDEEPVDKSVEVDVQVETEEIEAEDVEDIEDEVVVAVEDEVAEEKEAETVLSPVEEEIPVLPVKEEPKNESRRAVIDAMASKQAWRTDMPGLAVKDIRSAISLNDRLIFINYLFHEDPMAFQESLTKINALQSLDEVVSMLAESHPEWDFESEVVYRFMMAVRRKIR